MLELKGLPVPDFARWIRESSEKPSRHWEKVSTDVAGIHSLNILIEPYRPYLPTEEGVVLSSFYVASNRLHGIAGSASVNVPVKPLLNGYAIGEYGRNGVISITGIGTRFAAAVIASGEEPDDKWKWDEERPLSDCCAGCQSCMHACPTGALLGNGRLDIDKCLRAQAQYQTPPMPYASRGLIGASAWGCEVCQEVCPRNAGIVPEKMPDELEAALNLKKLLRGDVEFLGKWIGSNYARPARMQARASLVAANLGRYDLYEEIKKLLTSPVEAVRDCAGWSLKKLEDIRYE